MGQSANCNHGCEVDSETGLILFNFQIYCRGCTICRHSHSHQSQGSLNGALFSQSTHCFRSLSDACSLWCSPQNLHSAGTGFYTSLATSKCLQDLAKGGRDDFIFLDSKQDLYRSGFCLKQNLVQIPSTGSLSRPPNKIITT